MRTLSFNKRLLFILNGLKWWIISGKKTLTARQAALYLRTDVSTIYRLKERYYLPYYKTQQQHLYFKRSEIDAWLKPRRRRELPGSMRVGKVGRVEKVGRVQRTASTPFLPPQQTSLEENWHAGEGAVRRAFQQ